MRIVTTSDCNFIGIPFCPPSFFGTELIDITINWGDGQPAEHIRDTSADHIFTNADGAITVTHSYSSAGQYTIVITGGFGVGGPAKQPGELAFAQTSKHNAEGFAQDYDGRAPNSTVDKILKVILERKKNRTKENFRIHGQGDFKDFTNLETFGIQLDKLYMILSSDPSTAINKQSDGFYFLDKTFKNCTKLTGLIDFKNVRPYDLKCTSMQSTFENSSHSSNGLFWFKAWNVVNAQNMFKGSQFNGNLKNLFHNKNTALLYADSMFENSVFNQPIQHWKFTNVKSATFMFKNSQFNQSAKLLFFKNDSLEAADGMFEGSAFNKPIASWELKSVKSADSMFKNSQFNAPAKRLFEKSKALTDVDSMFEGSEFNQDITYWNMNSAESADSMFKNSQFNKNARNLFTYADNLKDVDSMFEGSKFNQDIQHWQFENVESADSLFENSEFNANVKSLFSSENNKLKDADDMFKNSQLQSLGKDWSFKNVETANGLFAGSYVENNLDNLFKEGSSLVSATGMFEGRAPPVDIVDDWEIPATIKEVETKLPNVWETEEGSWGHKFITWDLNTVLWTYNKSNHWEDVDVDWEDAG